MAATATAPYIRRLACTTDYDELVCSVDGSVVRVTVFGVASCAYGHTWTGQRDARGRAPIQWEDGE